MYEQTGAFVSTCVSPSAKHVEMPALDIIQVQKAYDSWSETYDEDNNKAGYNGPRVGAEKLLELLPGEGSKILDCPCGTGQAAREVKKLDINKTITGVDISEKSLALAKRTGLFDSLHKCDIMKDRLPFDDDTFDAILCVGGFIRSHLNQDVFPEFHRVVKPGGVIVIVMREQYLYTAPEFRGGRLDCAIVQGVEDGKFDYLYRQQFPRHIQDHEGVAFAIRVK
ncbi:methyltransferase-like protein 27 [Diadema setosum]|uniref:methyltransferase-like protein 27 n=1 Tax=Diadema setosum TaxID=31175 RepID=UPI003B3B7329